MARHANGYLTNDGTFFNTKHEAELYEATADVLQAVKEHPILGAFEGERLDKIGKEVLGFIGRHKELIGRYVQLISDQPSLDMTAPSQWDQDQLMDMANEVAADTRGTEA